MTDFLKMLAKQDPVPRTESDEVWLAIADIRRDEGIQSRSGMNFSTMAEYSEEMKAHGWGDFPAVLVYWDGEVYWLARGFHRIGAAENAGLTQVRAKVVQGSRRDAILSSASDNVEHGLRRTNADKRFSAMLLLRDEEWRKWSDHQIGNHCKVDHKTVGKVRAEMEVSGEIPQMDKRTVERNGTTYEMTTTKSAPEPQAATDETTPFVEAVDEPTSVQAVQDAALGNVEFQTEASGQTTFGVIDESDQTPDIDDADQEGEYIYIDDQAEDDSAAITEPAAVEPSTDTTPDDTALTNRQLDDVLWSLRDAVLAIRENQQQFRDYIINYCGPEHEFVALYEACMTDRLTW